MSRIFLLIISLAVMGFMAYWAMYQRANVTGGTGRQSAKQQLDNVRTKAKSIEQNDQQRVDDAERKALEGAQ